MEQHRVAIEQFKRQTTEEKTEQYRIALMEQIIHQMRSEIKPHKLVLSKHAGKRYRSLPGNVYVISVNNEYYKIGYANNVKKRIQHLQLACPYPIQIVHIIMTDHTIRLETALHKRYRHRHVQGEWFRLSPDEVQSICSIVSPVIATELHQYEVDDAS